jgi:hypothetical protein
VNDAARDQVVRAEAGVASGGSRRRRFRDADAGDGRAVPGLGEAYDATVSRVAFTILGEPASKANSREIGVLKWHDKATGAEKSRPTVRKSDKALNYEKIAALQIPVSARAMFQGPVRVTMTIFYASERPDLDESVVLDVLQARYAPQKKGGALLRRGVYKNDRQVREKHIYWGKDPANPRTEIVVEAMTSQQPSLQIEPIESALPEAPF